MNYLKRLISVVALLAVAACGGGGGNPGDPITGPGSGSGSVADIVLVLSATTVTNKGTDTVVATATAVDSNRNAVADVPLTISVDANAVVTTSATKTNTAGQLAATVGIGSDRTNRTITITAKAGSLTRTTTLSVVDAAATNSASDLVLVLSSTNIANTGTRTVTATVTALDGKRNALSDVAVTLTADNGAVVTSPSKVTGASGTVTATIGIGSNLTNRDIVVTAQSGSLTRSTVLKVVTDPGTTAPVADDLSLVISAPSVTNGGSNTIIATATAVDRNRNVLAGIPVTFAVDASATAAVSGTVTNSSGVVTATIGIGADRSNRVVTVTATTTGLPPRSTSFAVTGAKLTSSASPFVVASTEGNVIEYTLVDFNAIAMADQAITVQGAGLPTATGKTDLNGKFRYTYKAPAVAGSINVTATSAGDARTDSIVISSGSSAIPPVVDSILSASVTPTPSVVTVNSVGSNTNQVELRALFVGADNRPLKNVRARFDLAGDKTTTDGVVSWVGPYAYSDANGIARGTFTPGQRSSPTNGITIRVCYSGSDFASGSASACDGVQKSATATLTVASEALSVTLRTNELIKSPPDDLTYAKEYVVMVVDAAGQAKADVVITPFVDLTGYRKGFWFWNGVIYQQSLTLNSDEYYSWTGESWSQVARPAFSLPTCPNEDANRNGVLEGLPLGTGTPPAIGSRLEDLNWNGTVEPRKADVAVKMVGSNKTDSNGLAIVQVQYGRNVSSWIDYVLTVTASGVSGTEARAAVASETLFPALAIRTESQVPAFVLSPYGRSSVCSDDK